MTHRLPLSCPLALTQNGGGQGPIGTPFAAPAAMSLLVAGVNYKTAPIDVRERIAFAPEQLGDALCELRGIQGIDEALILSTCNRTEIYCNQADSDLQRPFRWLAGYHKLKAGDLEPYLFSFPQEETVRHLLRVACGLDSMVLGEPQILGQLKNAYRAALRYESLGKLLNRLFQHAFAVAKKIRTDTAIGTSPVSVAFAAVRLAQQIFGQLDQHTALLIGAGDTIELVAHHLRERGIHRMVIANRSVDRSQALAARFGAYGAGLAALPELLKEADIVVSATASTELILTPGMVGRALKLRRHRPMFLVDVAVPRDIDPEVGTLGDAYLYTVDDLEAVIRENLQSRQLAALQADEIIAAQVRHFMEWVQSLDAISTLRALRGKAGGERDRLLALARRQLARGDDPAEVLDQLAHRLTNRLVHAPSVRLREACASGRSEILRAARELFELEPGGGGR